MSEPTQKPFLLFPSLKDLLLFLLTILEKFAKNLHDFFGLFCYWSNLIYKYLVSNTLMKFITIHLMCISLFFNSDIFSTCLLFYNYIYSKRIVKFCSPLRVVNSYAPELLHLGHALPSKLLTIGSFYLYLLNF